MNQLQKFQLMTGIKLNYTDSKMSDSEFAKSATASLLFPVSLAQVRSYRISLGIASNSQTPIPSHALELLAEAQRLLELRAKRTAEESALLLLLQSVTK
jgi:hypothetical protein